MSFAGRSPNRRRLAWATTRLNNSGIANGVYTATDLLSNWVGLGGSREGCTVMRTHITGAFGPSEAGDSFDVGLLVATLAASGTTELKPDVEPYEPWLLNTSLFPTFSGAAFNASVPFSFDVKSKRKLPNIQDTLWWVWVGHSTGNTSLAATVRILLALP